MNEFFINKDKSIICSFVTDLLIERYGEFRKLTEEEIRKIEPSLLEETVEKWYCKFSKFHNEEYTNE
jgi:hypothetical protein